VGIPAPVRVAALLVVLAVCAALQQVAFRSVAVWEVRPDLLLAFGLVTALLTTPETGLIWALVAGGATWAMVGETTLATFLITRGLPAFLCGLAQERLLRRHLMVGFFGVIVGTLVAEGLHFLFAPDVGLRQWVRIMLVSPWLNGLAALPLYAILSRLLPPRERERP
jgi:cell shape-determining protein MreD